MTQNEKMHLNPNIILTDVDTKVSTVVSTLRMDPDDTFMPKLIEALGGEVGFDQLPLIVIKGTGATGYLDFLRSDDVNHPVCKGVDVGDRPFVTLRVAVEDEGYESVNVMTLHRRYQTGKTWVGAGAISDRMGFAGALTDSNLEYVSRLVKGEKCGVADYRYLPIKADWPMPEDAFNIKEEKQGFGSTILRFETGSVKLV